MSATKSTTADEDDALTDLAKGIKTDEPQDTRDCPHEDCHGSLTLTDSDRVVCETCRVTPSGIFLYPPMREVGGYGHPPDAPLGSHYEDTGSESWNEQWMDKHSGYDNEDEVRLAGGYERVYDADDHRRPDGVTDEYTFNLYDDDLKLGESSWSGKNP